jgi:TonB-linked SusC/RagA family outer membrane protein
MGNLFHSTLYFLQGVIKMIPPRRLAIPWLFVFLLAGFTVQAQVVNVTGTVTDVDGITLPGVNVVVRGTTTGTVTDASGFYSIQVESGAILVYSFVGMLTREIRISDQEVINVALDYSMIGLDELVVIGYGTQSRRTLTTAVSRVDAEKIEDVPLTAVSTAIQGKVAGVRVYQSSGGQPGSNSTIRIRGGSSITQSNEPLILVDGVERGLADINPNDIESIQVLKDASGTAIYGARASNGVVLVTTKRGQHAKANITFTTNTGFATPWKTMDLLNAEEYLNLVRPAVARSNWATRNNQRENFGIGNGPDSPWSTRLLGEGEAVPAGYLSMPDPLDPNRTIIFQDNDFQDITLNTALEQIHNLSATGGTENIRYAASLGYSDIEGTSVGTQWNRFSGRANVDFRLRDNLGLSTRMDHSSARTNSYGNQRDVFHRSIFLAPTAKVYMEDGTYAHGNNRTMTNPLWYNEVNQRDAFNYRTGVGATLDWYVIPELKMEVRGDYFLRNRTFEAFEKANIFTSARESVFEYDQNKHWQLEGIVTYDKTLAIHHSLNIVAGVSALWFEDLSSRMVGEGASTDLIWTLNAAPTKLDATTSRQGETLRGIFGRATYDYMKKYLFSASLRRDESSRFAKETRVGYFPSASVGWIMSEENFMSNVPVINTLKLRGSLGQTGNNSINRNAFAGVYGVGYNYAGLAGTFPTVMPNRALRWETTTQWDVGIDLGLFRNDRFRILFDFYEKVTKDLLFSVPMPNESGFSDIQQNVGDVKFWGYEIDLQADILSKRKVQLVGRFQFWVQYEQSTEPA